MSSPKFNCFVLTGIALIGVQACTDQTAPTAITASGRLAATETDIAQASRHIVLFVNERVPANFAQVISSLGGSVEAVLDSVGVATVTGLSDAAAASLRAQPEIEDVEPDLALSMSGGRIDMDDSFADAPIESLALPDATESPTLARFYARQWNMRAVFAPEAWAAGHLGSRDVLVAILDTGIDYLHPDLAGLVDLERSKSFVPEEVMPARYADRLPISDLFWHGTAVASIVASNAKIAAGINRHATLLAVKIADSTFRTTRGRLVAGIVYAADQGADVINISNGVERDKSDSSGIAAVFERAANYAFRKGALIVSVPFNDSTDLDHNGDKVRFPCEAAHVICASATGPARADGVNGPWYDIDAPASYSAFGRSAVTVAAPGGAGEPGQFRRVWVPCTTTPTQTTAAPACIRREAVAQGRGTSFAAPTVSGLAALLVAQLGHGKPALIAARIMQTADDLGEPGTDPFYGKGRINVARALGIH